MGRRGLAVGLLWSGAAALAWAVLRWYAGPALQFDVGWLLALCGGAG